MLLLLLVLAVPVCSSRTVAWDQTNKEAHFNEVSMSRRPLIYYCRSRSMEDFSCYWHPLDNVSNTDGVSYVLTYRKENGPVLECPDYLTSGPNSCHFDTKHTAIWKMYCMKVTAITPLGNYTSPQHCLDVAEIVETEAPVNLTFELHDAGGDEMGHRTVLSWTYPKPSDLQFGWITLEYELQYRRLSEPHHWKTKGPLREPQVELLGLSVGEYVVQVRCKSYHYGRWSQWSLPLYLNIPARPPTGKLLLLVLVPGICVVALIGFMVGLVHQSKRIKAYFLPPIPKPRILGIDPLLLKKGRLDEINRHFSSFHGYSPPSYSYADDLWDRVSADDLAPAAHKDPDKAPLEPRDGEQDALIIPCIAAPLDHDTYVTSATQCFATSSPPVHTDFIMAVPGSEYSVMTQPGDPCPAHTNFIMTQPGDPNPAHTDFIMTQPGDPSPAHTDFIMTVPGSEYSVMAQPSDPSPLHTPHKNGTADFYTCVQMMQDTGEVHLVPCLPPAYCSIPNWDQKTRQKDELEARKKQDGEATERNQLEVRLLSETVQ